MRRLAVALMCVLTALGTGVPRIARSADTGSYKTEEVKLGDLPKVVESLTFSELGCHYAYFTKQHGKWVAVVDGQAGPGYDGFVLGVGVQNLPGTPTLIFSRDGKHAAYSQRKGKKWLVVVDGQPGPEYDAVGFLTFSPDGERMAYYANDEVRGGMVVVDGQEHASETNAQFSPDGKYATYNVKTGGKGYTVLDGQTGPEYDGIVQGSCIFSRDGRRVAYAATKGDKSVVVVDGHPGPEYDAIWRGSLVFSPDGGHVAYVAWQGGDGQSTVVLGEKSVVVVDGQPGPEYDFVPNLQFSPDGKRMAFVAHKGGRTFLLAGQPTYLTYLADYLKTKDEKSVVVVDGRPGPEYDYVSGVQFSADGSRVAYVAHKGEKSLAFADGKQMAYVPQKGEKCLAVVDGQPEPEYEGIQEPVILSPDGKRVAYAVQRSGKSAVVVDGQMGPEYDYVMDLQFSPDGKHSAYQAQKGKKWFAVVDGQAGQEYDSLYPLRFSPDGKHVAYRAKKGKKWLVVMDGQPGSEYNWTGDVQFSPDGKHSAYQAGKYKEWFVVIDGQSGPQYDDVSKGPAFGLDGSIEYMVIKEKALFRVKHVPSPGP
ncbi:MAG: hypothetical protein Q7T82_17230 [Armatimonadota bacterium]|nr:hypothetical protein [Armatimonadota bacterium]